MNINIHRCGPWCRWPKKAKKSMEVDSLNQVERRAFVRLGRGVCLRMCRYREFKRMSTSNVALVSRLVCARNWGNYHRLLLGISFV